MGLTLSKGENLSLSKTDPSLNKVVVGLGWDARATDGADFDLDASVFMLDASGKVRSQKDFIFYNQMESACKSVVHSGDNRTGEGEGDDEQIKVDLSKIPEDVQCIAVVVTIHDAEERKQTFGQVSNAFIRLVNEETGAEVVRYDLTEDMGSVTASIFADIYREQGEWKFKAIGEPFNGGLKGLANKYGVQI